MTDLWHALDKLEGGKRWGTGELFKPAQQTYCVLGALQAARGVDLQGMDIYPEEDDPDVEALAEVIREQYPHRGYAENIPQVFTFNDDLSKDQFDELRLVMEKAAVRRDEILS